MDMLILDNTPLLWILLPAAAAAVIAVYDIIYRRPSALR
jgi:hypothetical protein